MEHHVTESGELAVEILQEMGYWTAAPSPPGTRGTRSRMHEDQRGSC